MNQTTSTHRLTNILGPDRAVRKPKLEMPPGACDCHSHVFGSQQQYPYVKEAAYIADYLPAQAYIEMLRAVGFSRAVLVQPSVYGTDNSCMVDTMRVSDFDFRGVVVVDPDISDAALDELHAAGARGVRINAYSKTPGLRLEHADAIAKRIKRLGWHMQFFTNEAQLQEVVKVMRRLPIPGVIDHFGHVHAADGINSQGFQAVLDVAQQDHVWVKLSGGYRVSTLLPPFEDVVPLAQALISVAPDRCVFGTDWPHPNVKRIDNDADLVDALGFWISNQSQLHRVLVDNPSRLYQFD